MHIQFFPPEIIALQHELSFHNDLQELLALSGETHYASLLGCLAGHLGIILDGAYSPVDILQIAKMCTQKMYEKRTQIILPLN